MAAGIADQGTASATNFFLNIFLARVLSAHEYGAYAVAWSILLVLVGIHNALILESMTILGPAEHKAQLDSYLASVRRLNWPVSAALAVLGMVAALFYKEAVVRSTLCVMALCVPGYLTLLLNRRRQYVLGSPDRAFRLSAIYGALVFAWLATWHQFNRLSAATAAASFGVAWLIALLPNQGAAKPNLRARQVLIEHWRYAKWLFASSILTLGAGDLQTVLLSMLVDLKSAGILRAMLNFILPLSQLLTVLSVYSLPKLSGRAAEMGEQSFLKWGIFFPPLMIVVAGGYVAVLVFLSGPIEHLLYGGKLQADLNLMPLLGAAALIAGISGSFSTLLRAVQNSAHQFACSIAATAVGAVFALLLLPSYGLKGALWSMIAANTAIALVILGTYLWLSRRKPQTALP